MGGVANSTSKADGPKRPVSGGETGQAEYYPQLETCGIALAGIAADGRPIVGKGSGSRADGHRLRISFRKPSNEQLIEAVRRGSPIAVTFSQPTTHASIQFKARAARIDDPEKEDLLAAQRQRELFSAELIECAYSAEFAEGYTAFAPHELAVLEFTPEESFDQTPGPAAGARLR